MWELLYAHSHLISLCEYIDSDRLAPGQGQETPMSTFPCFSSADFNTRERVPNNSKEDHQISLRHTRQGHSTE
jgi:hypothetical protein